MAIEDIKLGTCLITLDGADLGYTKGGVEVSVETSTHDTMIDQFGETPVKSFIQGRTCKVVMNLAETTLDNLVKIMPGATKLSTSGNRVDVTSGVGEDLQKLAKPLILHPIALPINDKSEDFTLPAASTPGAINFAYKKDDERVFTAEFMAYPDANGILFSYGDPAATA